ncbi:MAG: Shikimate 5-dehydrogenase I alpha, partial [uncultured Nocardioidaceae bacterium]
EPASAPLRRARAPDRALALPGAAPRGVRRDRPGVVLRRGRRDRARPERVPRGARRLLARPVTDHAAETSRHAAPGLGGRRGSPGRCRQHGGPRGRSTPGPQHRHPRRRHRTHRALVRPARLRGGAGRRRDRGLDAPRAGRPGVSPGKARGARPRAGDRDTGGRRAAPEATVHRGGDPARRAGRSAGGSGRGGVHDPGDRAGRSGAGDRSRSLRGVRRRLRPLAHTARPRRPRGRPGAGERDGSARAPGSPAVRAHDRGQPGPRAGNARRGRGGPRGTRHV